MDGVDKKVGKVLPMVINEMTTYEAVDGIESWKYWSNITEMLLLWKESKFSYSLSFLQSEDRDSILYILYLLSI